MGIRCTGIAKLRIPETNEFFEVKPDDLEWEVFDSCERPMDAELSHSAAFYYYSEKEGFEVKVEWEAFEYPIGTIECFNVDEERCELLEDFDIDSDSVDEDYDDQLELDAILSNTEFYRTFCDEISNLLVLNSLTIADFNAQRTLKRQIFIGAITCLETYLSDAFINTVLSNEKNLKSFFSSFKDFEHQKIKKSEIFSYYDKAESIAKEAMLKVIFHKLDKVSNMYKSTFKIIFPDISAIEKDIATRHDLVHRNGKTKKGHEVIVDEVVVNGVINRIKNFVDELDQQLKDKYKSQ